VACLLFYSQARSGKGGDVSHVLTKQVAALEAKVCEGNIYKKTNYPF
jgi:hypothetical protein